MLHCCSTWAHWSLLPSPRRAPVSCNRFYSYIWWTLWYDFMALVLLSYVLAKEIVHITRYFVIAFLVPLTYLLMSTTYADGKGFWGEERVCWMLS